jgi:hypothetical protein
LPLPRFDHDRPFAQAIGQCDLHLTRHQESGLESGFSREPVGNQPNTDPQNAEDHYDGGAENRQLLLP